MVSCRIGTVMKSVMMNSVSGKFVLFSCVRGELLQSDMICTQESYPP
jgi:hypothetical protein